MVDVAVRRGRKEERHVQKRQRVSTVSKKEEERDIEGEKEKRAQHVHAQSV